MKRLLLVAALLAASLCGAENLLVNGDMSSDKGWKLWGGAPSDPKARAAILTYPAEGPAGERVMKILDELDTHNTYVIQHCMLPAPSLPKQRFMLKFKAKAPEGQTFLVSISNELPKTADRPGKYFGGTSHNFTGTGAWTEYAHEFRTVPAGGTRLGLSFFPFPPTRDNSVRGTLRVTAVTLETAPPLKPEPTIQEKQKIIAEEKITLHDRNLRTDIVREGKPCAVIVGSPELAAPIVEAVRAKTGATLEVVSADPGKVNLITIGNRDRNDFVSTLYNFHYTLLDAKYPGKGGSETRSLHDPFGDKRNIILCGGSDLAGDRAAVAKLVKQIDAMPAGKDLHFGFFADVTLDPAYKVPENAKDAKLWCESRGYGNSGFFGWNSLSKNLALLYITGRKQYADEFLRLAFPKDKATEKELFKLDGESYKDDYSDPIASVYHYRGIMMVLYWDLVEANPVWTDADRLKVKQAMYRQLKYTLTKKDYTNPYGFADARVLRGIDRHIDWEGCMLYAVARYFEKHQPCLGSKEALRLVRNFMEPRFETVCYGTTSRFWAHSNMEPDFFYAILSGDRKYIGNRAIGEYARDLLITSDGSNRPDTPDGSFLDRTTHYSPVMSFLQLAYLTQDDAFVRLTRTMPIDQNCFRLGQSFWPIKPYGRDSVKETMGRWNAYTGEKRMAAPFPDKYVVNVMSYRDAEDGSGDYMMLDTSYATGLREVARAFALFNIRIDGEPVLRGHGNTLRLYSDGGCVAPQPYYAKVLDYGVSGPFVYAKATVPDLDGFDWTRTVILRKRGWLLLADEVVPKRDLVSGEIYNDFFGLWPDVRWTAHPATGEYVMNNRPGKMRDWLLSTSADVRYLVGNAGWTTYLSSLTSLRMFQMHENWKKGEPVRFVTLIRPGKPDSMPSAARQGDEIALALPAPALFRFTPDGFELDTPDGKLVSSGKPWQFAADARPDEAKVRTMLAARKIAPPPAADKSAPAPIRQFKTGGQIRRLVPFTDGGKTYYAVSAGKSFMVLDAEFKPVFRHDLGTETGPAAWQASKRRILVGCRDETVRAYDLAGKECWRFTSEMAPELLKFGPYWHKSAIPGIRSILVDAWPDGREQVFVGSEGTLEVLDSEGKFVKRLYIQYGPVSTLVMQRDPARLWCLRWTGGWLSGFTVSPELKVENVGMLTDAKGVPMTIFGFSGVGKTFFFPRKDALYGDFTGVQNRVVKWDLKGKVLADVNLGVDTSASGAGFGEPIQELSHLRHLNVLPDGTVAALTRRARAYFWTPDLKLKKMIVLPEAPFCGTDDGQNLYAGLNDGRIVRIMPDGMLETLGRTPAQPRVVILYGGRLVAGDKVGNLMEFSLKK